MQDFTDLAAIKRLDPQDTYTSTELLLEQLETAWNEVNALDLPHDIAGIKNIVFCGMGASIYGALVLKALQGAQMPYPTETVTDYHLPAYVDKHSLVVLTSYSGTTEEVLSCAEEALNKDAKMIILTRGGPLAEFANEHNIPAYIFDGKANPSGVPRLGTGYSILGLIGLMNKLQIITVADEEIQEAITRLKEKLPELKARATRDYSSFIGKIPVIFAAEHLSGNGQILRNQFNETSKTFSDYYLVPDLNHHLMEGLQFPEPSPLLFLVLNTRNYSEKISRRMDLTIDVVKQNKQNLTVYTTEGQTLYDDFLEALIYGSYLTLFLALSYDQNPAVNPWVDYFKGELKKR
jgi:glucose/mannose-6-phosphate isomerase